MSIPTQTQLVWPWFIRAFHWSIVALLILLYVTAEVIEEEEWHAYCGYVLLALLVLRTVYGLLTRNPFTSVKRLIQNTQEIPSYLRSMFNAKQHYLGHNPLGGLMVLCLLAILLIQTLIGLFISGDDFDAPLYFYISDDLSYLLSEWHELLFDVIVCAVALHVAAIVFYQLVYKENLVRAMITGKKPDNSGAQDAHTK